MWPYARKRVSSGVRWSTYRMYYKSIDARHFSVSFRGFREDITWLNESAWRQPNTTSSQKEKNRPLWNDRNSTVGNREVSAEAESALRERGGGSPSEEKCHNCQPNKSEALKRINNHISDSVISGNAYHATWRMGSFSFACKGRNRCAGMPKQMDAEMK